MSENYLLAQPYSQHILFTISVMLQFSEKEKKNHTHTKDF